MPKTEGKEKCKVGDEARWAPTSSYLSCQSWPGPPQTHWPSWAPVPAAGSWRAPSCPQRWRSSPRSCCWSSVLRSADAAAQSLEHRGPYQQAGEAGQGGKGGGVVSPSASPSSLFLLTTICTPCHKHSSVCTVLSPCFL